ncbi:hypothetical protein IAE60_02590 [Pseudoxanthomonas mexicana]|jgi:hypothetical protein|uniref:Uncharacterized protein n=1 Tax=Pseudoxanthomonas mexicana TaxID=128785 RepID=A0A7G9TE20_PSEMX|nr:hypothetical protein [Pseudoxanthomonas mexicana]MCP1585414.1 hypothetical protein [Pseudoxanthomonas mexicana]QNN78345.1 hypothetical protein IAE60_02590 [Pseudoxanthomonas mexicana]
MKYKESLIPKTQKDLHDYICNVMLSAPTRRFLDFEDFDGAFFVLERGIDNLLGRFGDMKSKQLLDMLQQAKTHYESGDNKLGGALMEDTRKVVMGRQPWAYPKELYRWAV